MNVILIFAHFEQHNFDYVVSIENTEHKKGCIHRKNTNFCAYILKYSLNQGVQRSAGKFWYVSGFVFVDRRVHYFTNFYKISTFLVEPIENHLCLCYNAICI